MRTKVFVLMMGCALALSCREVEKVEVVEEEDAPAVAAVEPKELEPLTDEQLGELKVQGVKMYKKVNQLYRWRNTVKSKESRIEWYPEILAKLPELERSLEEKKMKAKRLEQEYKDHLNRTNDPYSEVEINMAERSRALIAGFDDELAALKKENAELRDKLEKKGKAP
jgi:hypothetical protein